MMRNMNTNPMRLAPIAVNAMIQSVTNIMTTQPTSMTVAVTRVETDWLSVCPMVSTSLVTRESVSPTVCESKYFSGRSLIFSETARRMLREFFCVTPAISQFWIKEQTSDAA